ncbi:hypothetical protein LZ554_006931 [Drepanopeziza brunnea f. sp. 'monogermtubi']|nr:hypothetical protein LZ554_006931 [Drepanopeziza brunnea f. sp. 'monogermtubi']
MEDAWVNDTRESLSRGRPTDTYESLEDRPAVIPDDDLHEPSLARRLSGESRSPSLIRRTSADHVRRKPPKSHRKKFCVTGAILTILAATLIPSMIISLSHRSRVETPQKVRIVLDTQTVTATIAGTGPTVLHLPGLW